ncbi:uncharacterized protein LOC112686824 [Sipha flava]|uniref:Uncharacterized protein LOC112686824 n=2 Tax=Sipha flava TaxID=143950 RepID=A0A8B8FVQ2_9HEMI|nr:uncharacterized protein LOC112686824 [Sipha flava]
MNAAAADIGQIDNVAAGSKNALSRTKGAPNGRTAAKRHRTAVELSPRVDRRTVDELLEWRRASCDNLGKVLRSLYVFESRLRKEQRQIRRQLGERDAVIRQQQVEIAKLRQTVAQHCSRCEDVEQPPPPPSKPDLITCITPHQSGEPARNTGNDADPREKPTDDGPWPAVVPSKLDAASRKTNVAGPPPPVVDARAKNKNPNTNVNFNKNVYSKTVTDLSLNDIASFPNPTPNNNLFVVSNSIFSKNDFTYNGVSKQAFTSVKQNGKVITSALKKADRYPSAKTVHFGKTTHIPEPDEDGQTDIVKTVETLLLRCGGDSTESENDTSSTASTETSPSVSQMVRKFESIGTTTTITTAGINGGAGAATTGAVVLAGGGSDTRSSPATAAHNGSYIADAQLKTAAELDIRPDPESELSSGGGSLSDLDPRNNFEEFRFEDSDLDREYRAETDGLLECPGRAAVVALSGSGGEDDDDGDRDRDDDRAGRINYESFLEVTGLSQKSIITVQSNRNVYGSHRNVQKPKDVKSRSRAKSASFEYKTYPSTVKYWTEPYL